MHYLLDLAKKPKNYGLLSRSDFCSHQVNPSCGDSMAVCGLIEEDKIWQARFEASGCVLSIAMASLLTEHITGMTVQDALLLNDQTVEQLLKIPLGINRLQCGMLSVIALQAGLRKYKGLV